MNDVNRMAKLLEGVDVEWKNLGTICQIKTGRGVTKKDCLESGVYPIISGGKEPMGYIDTFNRNENTVTISRVGANAGFVSFINRKFYLNDKCFSVLSNDDFKNKIFSKYIYHFLKSVQQNIVDLQSEGGVPTINTTKVSNIIIPIPHPDNPEKSLKIQTEIVRILDTFTELTVELTVELRLRKQQYNYYRDQLLSFEEGEVEWKRLGDPEIGEFIRGKRFVKTDMISNGVPCIHYGQMYTHYGIWADKSKSFVSPELVETKKLRTAEKGDVVFVAAGETIEDIGMGTAWFGDEGVVIHDACFFYKSILNPKYVAYFTRTRSFQNQIRKSVSSGKISAINAKGLGKVIIPIPSPEEQARIVTILDKFETLTNSISEGLPKEIALRQQQYEYYREQLLNFPKSEIGV